MSHDQSNRYADLSLNENDLIAGGRHVLCAYIVKPKEGYGYLETASHFAAESSTGTHLDGPAAGARAMRQAEQCWRQGADPLEFAEHHHEFARAFESFPSDADSLYPGWRDRLGVAAT